MIEKSTMGRARHSEQRNLIWLERPILERDICLDMKMSICTEHASLWLRCLPALQMSICNRDIYPEQRCPSRIKISICTRAYECNRRHPSASRHLSYLSAIEKSALDRETYPEKRNLSWAEISFLDWSDKKLKMSICTEDLSLHRRCLPAVQMPIRNRDI